MPAVQQLIPVFSTEIHGEQIQLADARTLHRFLGIDARFNDWISRRITEYGFQDGEDFYSALSKSTGGRRSREYHITLDMAKELSMVERNDRGRQARRYFIECEKRLCHIAPQEALTIANQTIGTDGFHCLASIIDGKLRHLPAPDRRRAKMHIWSQVHKAFSVVSAADIPANQLDSARNFVASYALEGEWIPRESEFDSSDWLALNCLIHSMRHSCEIFYRHNLYTHLTGLGSRAGIEMIDHLKDGRGCAGMLASKFSGPPSPAVCGAFFTPMRLTCTYSNDLHLLQRPADI